MPENAIKKTEEKFNNAFGKDLPAVDSLSEEIDRWVRKWRNVDNEALPKTLSQTYNATKKGLYPNISCIFLLLQLNQRQLNGQIQLFFMLKQIFVVPWIKRDSMT